MKTPGEVVGRARSWSEDDWWRLEIAAFREHRGVLMGLARKMPMDLWRDVQTTLPGTTFAGFLGGVCHLVSLVVAWALAPLLAIRCLVLAVRGFDAPLVAWQLGTVALVAAVSVFYPLFRWRGGATDRWTRVLVIGVLASTVIYLVTGLVAWERGGLDGSPLWLWAVAVGAVLSTANLLMATRAGTVGSRLLPVERAARLSHEEQARIRSELTGAIALLAHRGTIPGDLAQQARQLPLGTLGETLGSARPEPDDTLPAGPFFTG